MGPPGRVAGLVGHSRAPGGRFMQVAAYELPRILIPRTPVNKGAKKGGAVRPRPFCALPTARRSGALTLVPLPDQLLDRARQSRLEVDQLRPRRGHDDPDHAVVERTHLRLPLDPLLGRHLVAAVHLEVLVGDAVDDVQLGPPADEQDPGWV